MPDRPQRYHPAMDDPKNTPRDTDDEPNWLVRRPILALAALAVVGLLALVGWGAFAVDERFGTGAFGDSFGPVAALFNGLAFAAAIVAIVIQRHELELQRAEMRLSREEMRAQRAEMAEQRKAQAESAKQQKIANRLQAAATELAMLEAMVKVSGNPSPILSALDPKGARQGRLERELVSIQAALAESKTEP